jgi:hypothetical protein
MTRQAMHTKLGAFTLREEKPIKRRRGFTKPNWPIPLTRARLFRMQVCVGLCVCVDCLLAHRVLVSIISSSSIFVFLFTHSPIPTNQFMYQLPSLKSLVFQESISPTRRRLLQSSHSPPHRRRSRHDGCQALQGMRRALRKRAH